MYKPDVQYLQYFFKIQYIQYTNLDKVSYTYFLYLSESLRTSLSLVLPPVTTSSGPVGPAAIAAQCSDTPT